MRTRTLLTLGIALAACCLLFLRRTPSKHQNEQTQNIAPAPLGQVQPPGQPRAQRTDQPEEDQASAGGLPRLREAPPGGPEAIPRPPILTPEQSNALNERVLSAWQGPIKFYGIVVDENSNAVAGATVVFHWVEAPNEMGNRTVTRQSDADGLFALHGERGLSLGVSVQKEGYRSSRRDNDTYNYGRLEGEPFPADPQNPVVFHLRKKGGGVDLVGSENGIRPNLAVRIRKDNTPVRVDFFQKQVSSAGQLEVSQNKPPWREATEWSFRLTVPDGGLVKQQDEFPFEAPESGYRPTVEYRFTKSETNWITHTTVNWYIAFGQPRKYGWLRLESDIAQETVFITYAINPSGSRNLEPAN